MLGDLITVDATEQETGLSEVSEPSCPSCGHEHTIYLGTFPEVAEDAYGCRLCGREFNLIPDGGFG